MGGLFLACAQRVRAIRLESRKESRKPFRSPGAATEEAALQPAACLMKIIARRARRESKLRGIKNRRQSDKGDDHA
jgi:hypothetical protein